jgi:hypothetical protein
MVCSLQLLLVLASAVILRSEPRETHDHILLSQIGDSPNLEGQVPVFISLRKSVARLYPQALSSLFVVSYDSQGYGGGIRSRLHTGLEYGVLSAVVMKSSLFWDITQCNSIQLSSSSEAASCAAAQEFSNLLWNPKVYNRVVKNLSLVPTLSQIDPVNITPSYPSKIHPILRRVVR